MTAPDEYADRLAAVASELAQRVRDDNPDANARWLRNTLPNRDDRDNLLFVLAAAVPDDRSWHALTAWTVQSEPARRLAPHGTPAAAKRHRYHGEPLCEDCRESERVRERDRKRAQRGTEVAAWMSVGADRGHVLAGVASPAGDLGLGHAASDGLDDRRVQLGAAPVEDLLGAPERPGRLFESVRHIAECDTG